MGTDAHARRYEVPYIPLANQDANSMILTVVGRACPKTCGASVDAAQIHIISLEVRPEENRTRRIRRTRQETLWAPDKQIMTDQEHVRFRIGLKRFGNHRVVAAIVLLETTD
jgi:hypothetical protein